MAASRMREKGVGTILLLGKDGQVGHELQRSLAPLGPVVACGRAECDAADAAAVQSLLERVQPAVVVNAIAYTAVDRAESDEAAALRINRDLPAQLAAWTAASGALLVHYSTDYVFDGSKPTPYTESDLVAPLGVYGRSKLAGEEALRAAGGRALILRTSWVFGEHGGNFVKTILRLARERDSLNVVADQIGAPTPAALIADVTALMLQSLGRGQGMAAGEQRLYHLTAANPVSWHAFASRIVTLAAALPGGEGLQLRPGAITPIPSSGYPTPARRPANSRLDCRRLEADFGLLLPDWQSYLERMLARLAGVF